MSLCARLNSVVALFLITISIALLSVPVAQAGEAITFAIPQQYVSPRALGMGGAFVGLADDYNAIFYNPAGLARLEESHTNLGIGGAVDTKFVKLKGDIEKASGSNDITSITDLLNNNYGNNYHARATLGGIYARPRWALAIIPVDIQVTTGIHQLGGASLDLIAYQDTTIAYGYGWDVNWFKQDRMSLGVTAKAIYRGYYNKELNAFDLAYNSNLLRSQDAQEGLLADFDFGSLWTMKVANDSFMRFFRPSAGFTIRNVVDASPISNMHMIDKNSSAAPRTGRRFDLGTAFETPDWWIFKTRALADLRDIGADNFTFGKGVHLGAEFLWKIRNWWQGGWRVGVNQGYFTAGFTGRLFIFNLDLATYAEEMGPSDNPYASRRYVLKASLDW